MELCEFKNQLAPKAGIIGFDFGTKRLGIAVSDLSRTIASPYMILQRDSKTKDLQAIKQIIKEKEIGGMVFGLPLQMNGQEGEVAAEMRKFAAWLQTETGLPCAFWDERLSSSAMESFLIREADMSRAKRKKILDASAAAYILQGFLDALKRA